MAFSTVFGPAGRLSVDGLVIGLCKLRAVRLAFFVRQRDKAISAAYAIPAKKQPRRE